jgi:hypothetical protein
VNANGRKAPACASADALRGAHSDQLLAQARVAYLSVLKANAGSACAKSGLTLVTKAQCERAQRLAVVAPGPAREQLLAIAGADPPVPPDGCVWAALQALPAK